MTKLELRIPITGTFAPSDHGYFLYAALSRCIPVIHNCEEVSFDTLRGILQNNGNILLKADAQLKIRAPLPLISPLLSLKYQELRLGPFSIRLGFPKLVALRPSSSLYARTVTIKNHLELATFMIAVRAKLDAQGISADVVAGKRRVVKIGNHTVVGFSLYLHNLNNASSLLLLENGLGGRKHVGCGYFQGANPAFTSTRVPEILRFTKGRGVIK